MHLIEICGGNGGMGRGGEVHSTFRLGAGGGEVHCAFTNEGGGRIYCKLRGGTQDLISDFGDLHHNLPYDFGDLPPIYHLYHIRDLINMVH